jgi:hypothetical protein
VIWWLPLILGCGTQSAESEDGTAFQAPSSAYEYEGLPVLSVEHPERGSFDQSGSGTVRGSVSSGVAMVEEITINGKTASVDKTGRFEAEMGWSPGIQILNTHVEASNGERAVDGRAFHAGPVHEPEDWIMGAVRMEVGAEILDDDDDEPDDIAGLLELALEDESTLNTLIGQRLDLGSAIFTATDVSYGRARIDLDPQDGQINAVISLDGISIDFEMEGVDWYSGVGTTGSAWATSVDMGMAVTVASSGGEVRADVTDVEVLINGFGMTVEYVPDFLEDDISGWAEEFMEEAIVEMAYEEIPPLMQRVLSGFAIGATFDVDLSMEMRLAEIEVISEGVRFEADARVLATDPIEMVPGAGSLDTAGDPPDWPSAKDQPFWATVDDDLLNQLGFAFWATGQTKGFELDPVILGALSGGPLPAPLGPADSIQMSLNLPPVLTPPVQDDWAAHMAIGEWELVFNRKDGEVLTFSVSCRSHVQIELDADSEIAFSVDARPSEIELAVGVIEAPEALDPGDLAALVRLIVPPLLGNAGNFAPSIPIPEVALDEFLSVPATEGKVLRVDDPSILLEDNGWLILQAGIQVL